MNIANTSRCTGPVRIAINHKKYRWIIHRPVKPEFSFLSLTNNTCDIACTVDETKFLLSPFVRQRQNPCSSHSAVFQDLSTHHDGPVKKAIVEIQNALLLIH